MVWRPTGGSLLHANLRHSPRILDLPPAVAGLCQVYRPSSHKLEHHDRNRLVLLGPQAVAVVAPWLRPAQPDAFLFSPVEARTWYFAKYGHGPKPRGELTKKKVSELRPTCRYTVTAYGKAISRAIDKVNRQREEDAAETGIAPVLRFVPRLASEPTTPQCRHAVAGKVRDRDCQGHPRTCFGRYDRTLRRGRLESGCPCDCGVGLTCRIAH